MLFSEDVALTIKHRNREYDDIRCSLMIAHAQSDLGWSGAPYEDLDEAFAATFDRDPSAPQARG
jgi:hypothetical protein